MNENVFPRDRALTVLSMVFGVAVWGVVAVVLIPRAQPAALIGAAGATVIILFLLFIAYVFVNSLRPLRSRNTPGSNWLSSTSPRRRSHRLSTRLGWLSNCPTA